MIVNGSLVLYIWFLVSASEEAQFSMRRIPWKFYVLDELKGFSSQYRNNVFKTSYSGYTFSEIMIFELSNLLFGLELIFLCVNTFQDFWFLLLVWQLDFQISSVVFVWGLLEGKWRMGKLSLLLTYIRDIFKSSIPQHPSISRHAYLNTSILF